MHPRLLGIFPPHPRLLGIFPPHSRLLGIFPKHPRLECILSLPTIPQLKMTKIADALPNWLYIVLIVWRTFLTLHLLINNTCILWLKIYRSSRLQPAQSSKAASILSRYPSPLQEAISWLMFLPESLGYRELGRCQSAGARNAISVAYLRPLARRICSLARRICTLSRTRVGTLKKLIAVIKYIRNKHKNARFPISRELQYSR